MRFVTLFGLITIARSIDPASMSESWWKFLGWLLLISAAMDIVQFIKDLTKK